MGFSLLSLPLCMPLDSAASLTVKFQMTGKAETQCYLEESIVYTLV